MNYMRVLASSAALLAATAIGASACGDDAPVAEPGVTVAQPTPRGATPSPAPTATASPTPTPTRTLDEIALRGVLPPADQLDAYAGALRARNEAKWADAAIAFAHVADGSSPLAPIARLRQAQMLVRDKRGDAAIPVFDAAIAATGLPPALAMVAHQEASDALVPLGRRAEATAHLDAIVASDASTRAQVAEAQWDRAQLRRAAGDGQWASDALAVVRGAPGTSEATAALDALERVNANIPLAVSAYARYRARDDQTATQLYTTITAAPPTPAEAGSAWFFLGALAERELDTPTAITAYTRSLEADPRGALAADARWWLGLLLEEKGRFTEAAEQFRVLVDDFPNATYADPASIRAAVALAAGGGSVPAAAQLRAIAAGRDERLAAEASRWLQVLGYATSADAGPATYLPTSFAAITAKDSQLQKLFRACRTRPSGAPHLVMQPPPMHG